MDIIDIGLRFTYGMMIVGAIAAVVMPLIQALSNDPKSLLKSAGGLVVILVIYFIGYAMAGSEVTAKYVEFDVDSSISKMVGGVLITMYIMMILALGGVFYGEVRKIFE